MKIIKEGTKKYIIDEKRDLIIYKKIKLLEKKKINEQDKKLVKLMKTQLEGDWRKYLLVELNKLSKKYKA